MTVDHRNPGDGEGIRVRAYAGATGEEEPRTVTIEDENLAVEEILDRWREPGGRFFRVRLAGGRRLLLCCREPDLSWWLVPGAGITRG